MFIIDFVWGVLQLTTLAGTGLFVYSDYRRGWPTCRRLLEKGQRTFLRLTGQKEDEVQKAKAIVDDYARKLDNFRRAVAKIEANVAVSRKKAGQDALLAAQFQEVMESALRFGQEEEAAVAAEGKIQAEARQAMYCANVEEQDAVLEAMKKELLFLDYNLDVVITQAVTVGTQSNLARCKEQLYGLVSEVHVESGLTPVGELKMLVDNSERENLKAGFLLKMARSPQRQGQLLLHTAEVKKTLEEARQRIALLPAPENEELLLEETEAVSSS